MIKISLMKYAIPLLFSLALFLFSCSEKSEHLSLKDIQSIHLIHDKKFSENIRTLSSSYFETIYMGEVKDTLAVNYTYDLSKFSKWSFDYEAIWGKSENKVTLQIDTSKLIYITPENKPFGKDELPLYAHPVFLQNISPDTLVVGYGEFLPFYLEVMDYQGEWKTIEEPFLYMCGNGLNNLILPPNEIAITPVPVFNGNFRTKFRMRLEDTYSNEFTASIDSIRLKKGGAH